MVTRIARVWINRVRISILLVPAMKMHKYGRLWKNTGQGHSLRYFPVAAIYYVLREKILYAQYLDVYQVPPIYCRMAVQQWREWKKRAALVTCATLRTTVALCRELSAMNAKCGTRLPAPIIAGLTRWRLTVWMDAEAKNGKKNCG